MSEPIDAQHIDAASATTVGGAADADANFIAGNKRNGIKLRNGGDQNGWSNLFQRNRVYANAKALPGVDIDLEHSENAADSTHSEFPFNYANRDQSTPQICASGYWARSTASPCPRPHPTSIARAGVILM